MEPVVTREGEVFRTDRLLVRRWEPRDEQVLLAVYADPDVVRWVDDGQPLSPSEAEAWMHVTCQNYVSYGYGMFAIEDRTAVRTIGFGGIVHPGGQTSPEVKYAFERGAWGRGLATEFVGGLVHHAREVLELDELIATVAAPNAPSRAVLAKCGFGIVDERTEGDGSTIVTFAQRISAGAR